jgi:hypothetical protein
VHLAPASLTPPARLPPASPPAAAGAATVADPDAEAEAGPEEVDGAGIGSMLAKKSGKDMVLCSACSAVGSEHPATHSLAHSLTTHREREGSW